MAPPPPSAAGPAAVNSQSEVENRTRLGRIGWAAPLVLVAARTVLLLLGQGAFAAALALKGDPTPWQSAGAWWTVFGTVADLGCLGLLACFLRREGIRFKDLLGPVRGWRDLWAGLGYYALIMPIHFGAFFLSSQLVYGAWSPDIPAGILHMRALPLWAVVYSASIWWMIWSPTEETTYQAYALPRLQALCGQPWIAIAIVWFWWTLQHCALPLILDWKYVLWRFLCFVPGMLPTILIYHRKRRLAPMIVAHWPMDIVASLTTMIR